MPQWRGPLFNIRGLVKPESYSCTLDSPSRPLSLVGPKFSVPGVRPTNATYKSPWQSVAKNRVAAMTRQLWNLDSEGCVPLTHDGVAHLEVHGEGCSGTGNVFDPHLVGAYLVVSSFAILRVMISY